MIKVFEIIRLLNIYNFIEETFITRIENLYQKVIVPKFWNYFNSFQNECDGFKCFANSVNYLHNSYIEIAESNQIKRLDMYRVMYKVSSKIHNENSILDALNVTLRATVLSQLPITYKKTIESFYKVALCLEENLSQKCCCDLEECRCLNDFDIVNR